jgi:hypothetical protein
MKYLCLAYEEERVLNDLSQGEWQALRKETLDYVEALRESGHLIDARPLRSATTASVIRVRDGALAVTDGPFAETKDLIAGWMIIDVEDQQRAVELAGELSSAPGAGGRPLHEWLELRPFLEAAPPADG